MIQNGTQKRSKHEQKQHKKRTEKKNTMLVKRDASLLPQTELRKELMKRNKKPTGFWEDDMTILQTQSAASLLNPRRQIYIKSMKFHCMEQHTAPMIFLFK